MSKYDAELDAARFRMLVTMLAAMTVSIGGDLTMLENIGQQALGNSDNTLMLNSRQWWLRRELAEAMRIAREVLHQ